MNVLDEAGKFAKQISREKLGALIKAYRPHMDADVSEYAHTMIFYIMLRERGQSHNMAAMLACQSAPKANTDREFFEGLGTLSQQFETEEDLNRIVAKAKANGYTPNPNDVYMANVAKKEGDPEAFISPAGGRTQLKRLCEQRNLDCEGSVNHVAHESEPKQTHIVHPNIVDRKVKEMRLQDPDTHKKASDKDLASEVVSKHGKKIF